MAFDLCTEYSSRIIIKRDKRKLFRYEEVWDMIRLITGRAGCGKSSRLMNELRRESAKGTAGMIFLVPEQNSHETERRLAEVCGDTLSRYAEVLTFSRMTDRVLSETGMANMPVLDKGGRILMMSRALRSVKGRLKVYANVTERHEFLEELLRVYDDLKSCGAEAGPWGRGCQRPRCLRRSRTARLLLPPGTGSRNTPPSG